MRLLVAAVMAVAIFVFGVLLISRLFPYLAGWTGVCVVITCLTQAHLGRGPYLETVLTRMLAQCRAKSRNSIS
jgi:hypothetical protein